MLQQHLDDVGRMGRACLLYFRTLVRRDPETQEINFAPQFTPTVALRFLEVALKAQGAFAPSCGGYFAVKPFQRCSEGFSAVSWALHLAGG